MSDRDTHDDLDDLKSLFEGVETPAPEASKKAEALALAMKNFDRLQETSAQARPTSERPKTGLFKGVRQMIANLPTRGILTASTALAAIAMVAVLPALREQPVLPQGGLGGLYSSEGAAPEAEREVPMDDVVMEPVVVEEAPAFTLNDLQASAPPQPQAAPRAKTLNAAPQSGYSGGLTSLSGGAASPMPVPAPLPDRYVAPEGDTEAFPDADANPIKVTAEDPVSTFSVDVDTASWSVIRNSLNRGMLPPDGAVRIEEMVNYFHYDYPAPVADQPFSTNVGVSDSPWREGTQLVHIGLQGAEVVERKPLNLVFLIDTSGSMNEPSKLPLLVQSFRLMLDQLQPEDSVAIVTYAGSAGRVLDPTPASERETILAALNNLQAGGGTAGQAGLQQAYATAAEMTEEGDVSRVILATDGDFNIGISEPDALKDYIAKQRDSGTYLSVLGFGRGNLDDATMQALAQTGNGMAAYIDTLPEAQKVLVDQLTGTLFTIADDVKIQVEWNPAQVAEYRLIGYETRALNREDFNNDKVDAGEVGAGHQVTAIYEITPVGSDARMTDPLRYGANPVASGSDELGFLRLRYKAPGEEVSQLIETPILSDAAPLAEADWATAIAGFGQLLQGSDVIGDWSMGDAIALAQASKGADPYGYRQEAITLMRLADSLQR